MRPPSLYVTASCVVVFGVIVTSLGAIFRAPLGVTKRSFSTISTIAEFAGIPPKTRQPSELVVASSVPGEWVRMEVYFTTAVTPATPAVGAGAFPTSTSSADPVGGVMMLDSLTGGRMPSAGQVTEDVIWTLAAVCAVVLLTLQPVLDADALTAFAPWVIV